MGRQYNKHIKKARHKRYMERVKDRVKDAKRTAAKKK